MSRWTFGDVTVDRVVEFGHFPGPSAGRIVRAGGAWRFVFDDAA